jgi:hypothetical protein
MPLTPEEQKRLDSLIARRAELVPTESTASPAESTGVPTDIIKSLVPERVEPTITPKEPLTMTELLFPRASKEPTRIGKFQKGILDVFDPRKVLNLLRTSEAAPREARTIDVPDLGGPGSEFQIQQPEITPEAAERNRQQIIKSLRGETKGLAAELGRDPRLVVGPLGGIAAGPGILSALLFEGVPTALAGIAAKEQGEDVSGVEAVIDLLAPSIGPAVFKGLKGLGTKIFRGSVKELGQKPALKAGADLEKLFEHKVAGGLDKSISKIESKIAELGEELLNKVKGKEGDVNLFDIFGDVETKILERIESGKLTGQNKAVLNALDKLRTELTLSAPTGFGTVEKLLSIKRAWGKLGKFVRDAPPELTAEKLVANELADTFNKKLIQLVPEATELNKQLSDLLPLRQPLKDAAKRIGRKDLFGLKDAILIASGGGAGFGFGGKTGGISGALATALTVGGQRLSQSPTFGAGLRRFAESDITRTVADPSLATAIGRRGISTSLFGEK